MKIKSVQISSFTVMSNSLQHHGLQHARLLCPSPIPWACLNSCPVHWVGDAIWQFQSLSSPSPPALNLSQHQGLFQWVCPSHQVARYLSFSFSISPSSEYSELISFMMWSPCSPRDSQESSPTPQFKSINSLVLSFLYGPSLVSIHDYWKNHSFDYVDLCWQRNIFAF